MNNIQIFHNLLWSRYKGKVFSSLHELSTERPDVSTRFVQIAETDAERSTLNGVDLEYHQYPFRLLFPGSYTEVPKPRMIATMFAEVWRSDANLVVLPCYDKIEYWAMLLAAVLRGKRRAVFVDSTIHDRPQHAWKGWLKRLFLKNVHGVFAYGERAKEYVIGHGADPQCVYVRCQAAALPKGYSPESAFDARVRSAASVDDPRFLYVGRLSAEKAIPSMLHAFSGVLTSMPNARLIIVGAGSVRSELEALASSLGLTGNVEFTGSKNADELTVEYAQATCLILPSRSEPWGLVVNEALSYGCPVIVSDRCGCVPELVIDQRTGYAYRCEDVQELSTKMIAAVSRFSDIEGTANDCIRTVSQFTPAVAATQILDGCAAILAQR